VRRHRESGTPNIDGTLKTDREESVEEWGQVVRPEKTAAFSRRLSCMSSETWDQVLNLQVRNKGVSPTNRLFSKRRG
jgi:hypothetical protein